MLLQGPHKTIVSGASLPVPKWYEALETGRPLTSPMDLLKKEFFLVLVTNAAFPCCLSFLHRAHTAGVNAWVLCSG